MVDYIRYSMCWEDPFLVTSGLKISSEDVVLSIASGGENVFAILLNNPKKIYAIDSNLSQIYLIKLKIAAISELTFSEFVKFLGFLKSKNRLNYYARCSKHLTKREKDYWEKNIDMIKKGIIHCGRFEKYLSIFRRCILPVVLNKKEIEEYLSSKSIEEQNIFYHTKWNRILWKYLFKLFFCEFTMKKLGRDKSYFEFNRNKNLATHFYDRAKHGITQISVKDNYFMQYILTGTIRIPIKNHPYLDKQKFMKLKKLIDKIRFVNESISVFLKNPLEKSFNKFNLSDIFEMMSEKEYENVLAKIYKSAKKGALLCYWNNLVQRNYHKNIKKWQLEKDRSQRLFKQDRVFFYSSFYIEKLV